MKQVFLIHAHKDVDQLNALVARLCDEDFVIYVHLDKKSAIDPARVHPAARQVGKRVDVRWGGFSQVRATLNSLREILAKVPGFDKVIFLSAQDFPLLSNARFKREMAGLSGHELMEAMPMGPGGWNVPFRYQFFYREGGGRVERLACALANRVLRISGRRRRMVRGLEPWGGSSWWALSRACVEEVVRRADRDPRLRRFFGTVLCPDEMFFQTLVMNSPFRARVLHKNFRHIQWPEQGSRNPKVLVEADYDRIAASGAHFCRKLDSTHSAGLMPRLIALAAEAA